MKVDSLSKHRIRNELFHASHLAGKHGLSEPTLSNFNAKRCVAASAKKFSVLRGRAVAGNFER